MRFLKWMGRGLSNFFAGLAALSMIAVGVGWATNYTLTQGAGTTFGSLVVAGVNYAQHFVCDATTPSQCAAVSNTGQVSVAINGGSAINANGQQNMANSSPVTLANNQSVGDPCTFQVKSQFSIATSAGNLQLVAGVSAKKVYICSVHVIAATAAILNIIEGTGAACTTANEAAVFGSTTAGSGESYAANGGMTYGSGIGTVGFTGTAANGLCLLQSGTAALAGNITYVQQ